MQDVSQHKFEIAGLGRAPFTLAGYHIEWFTAPGAPPKPGGCCAYCFTGILHCFVIRDANGKTFTVGSECVKKTGDAGLIDKTKNAANAMKRETKAKADAARIEAAIAALPSAEASLSTMPHPNTALASAGRTLLDYVLWMLDNAGTAGKLNAARIIEQHTKGEK